MNDLLDRVRGALSSEPQQRQHVVAVHVGAVGEIGGARGRGLLDHLTAARRDTASGATGEAALP